MKFYLDANLSRRIAERLRQRGHDAVSAQEVGHLELSDPEQLAYATAEGRALVTKDVGHFIKLSRDAIASQKPHAGIILCPPEPGRFRDRHNSRAPDPGSHAVPGGPRRLRRNLLVGRQAPFIAASPPSQCGMRNPDTCPISVSPPPRVAAPALSLSKGRRVAPPALSPSTALRTCSSKGRPLTYCGMRNAE